MKLKRRNWSIANHEFLLDLAAKDLDGRAAFFDWDDTCIFGDCGEAFLYFQLSTGVLRLNSAELAALVPTWPQARDQFGLPCNEYQLEKLRDIIQTGAEALEAASEKSNPKQPLSALGRGLLALYRLLEKSASGPGSAYLWAIRLLAGFSPDEIKESALTCIKRELGLPPATFFSQAGASGLAGKRRQGIRAFPEMRELVSLFRSSGIRVYLVSASQPLIVAATAEVTGFEVDGIVGMAGETNADGLLTGHLAPGYAINYGDGKVANSNAFIGVEPIFVAGDSVNDLAMMTAYEATRGRLLLAMKKKPGLEKIYRLARDPKSGTLIQAVNADRASFSPLVPAWFLDETKKTNHP